MLIGIEPRKVCRKKALDISINPDNMVYED